MRAALLASVFGLSLAPMAHFLLPTAAAQSAGAEVAQVQPGGTVAGIRVVGNERIETGTIISYLVMQVGDPFSPERVDRSLKSLYATGLFSDVSMSREGGTLVVRVVENPIINRVVFEGNKKINDNDLAKDVSVKPRSVYSPDVVVQDKQRILDDYAKHGRFAAKVTPKIIKLDHNRVDLVFEIDEGDETYISHIDFVGNHVYSESKLKDVISSREEAWWRFLSSTDSYDPDRLNYDRELLRRFYLRNGYVDIDISNPTAELSPDRSAFFVSFTVKEGERYRNGKIDVVSNLRGVDASKFQDLIDVTEGDWYDGTEIEQINDALADRARALGYAFVDVKPNAVRDPKNHTVSITFNIGEAPRVYVERIDITGNVRTEDKVIRREFRLAEGDAFNADLVRRSRQRIEDTQYFGKVEVTSTPGSAPDKAVIDAAVEEKSTGELTLGGGYSTDVGALLNIGLHEHNLIGTAIDAGINGMLAQKQTQVDLSITDPYFLDRNLTAGIDIFAVRTDLTDYATYEESRIGAALSAGYEINEHLRQTWTYSLVNRDIYDVQTGSSLYVIDEAGTSLLSQIGQSIALDYRDSKVDPHSGYVVRLGTDYAGLGGDVRYVRAKIDANYLISMERLLGDPDYVLSFSAGVGQMYSLGQQERIIDRFFLGGDNLRGFETAGVGPHDIASGDSLGGRFIWTQSTELRFPLPVSPDLGLSGRVFADVGALSEASSVTRTGQSIQLYDSSAPRVGAGVGVSWKTPFGLINLDLAPFVIKQKYDTTQVFRFSFGTRF
jgi:outer membrane protein insertion porin family